MRTYVAFLFCLYVFGSVLCDWDNRPDRLLLAIHSVYVNNREVVIKLRYWQTFCNLCSRDTLLKTREHTAVVLQLAREEAIPNATNACIIRVAVCDTHLSLSFAVPGIRDWKTQSMRHVHMCPRLTDSLSLKTSPDVTVKTGKMW